MAQWDVYANPIARSSEQIPYLVDLQSDLLNGLGTRFVAPLIRSRLSTPSLPHRLSPEFKIGSDSVVLMPQEAGAFEARLLKHSVTSLRAHAHEITDALSAVISGI